MQKALIGKKVGMTQIFDEKGRFVPVTVVEAGPCVVSMKKIVESDGYAAVQMGYGDMKPHKVNKPMKGHFDKADVAPKKVLKEFRFEDTDAYNVGDIIKADVFEAGNKVDVTGKSKGKGFAGPCVRDGGSMGCCSSPSRVFKGKKMAGHLGAEKVTVQNLEIVKIDVENNLIAIKGAIPGPNKGYVVIKDSVKA